jgi:hypothetical protein
MASVLQLVREQRYRIVTRFLLDPIAAAADRGSDSAK